MLRHRGLRKIFSYIKIQNSFLKILLIKNNPLYLHDTKIFEGGIEYIAVLVKVGRKDKVYKK